MTDFLVTGRALVGRSLNNWNELPDCDLIRIKSGPVPLSGNGDRFLIQKYEQDDKQ